MSTLTFQACASQLMHCSLNQSEKESGVFTWEETQLIPFDELIVSWDAQRPIIGSYLIQVSVLIAAWSPWLDYAFWGPNDQYSFKHSLPEVSLEAFQDTIKVLNEHKANGFRIRVIAKEKASLKQFRGLHVSAIDGTTHNIHLSHLENEFINLNVAGLSQITLPDERSLRLCSPTSTTAVIRFLSNSPLPSPLEFANTVVDSSFYIYGNWILNTAQASHKLGGSYHCFVAHFTSFNQIFEQLRKGNPVVVSVQGPLKGSAFLYESGHLLVVKGFDSKNKDVLCMDPAFSSNALTNVKYALTDFLAAWGRRRGLTYVFNLDDKAQ
ncbi:MAG: C39 family peptidase [Parachlamydiaceae bacterium]|nr:C39 family peptidase [Parachlamydiaceae bacterium]